MSGPPDDVAIVGGGQEATSVNRVLSLVASLAGANLEPIHTETRAGDVRLSHADISLAGRLLGYRPEVGIEEGLRRTTAWFVGNLGAPERPMAGV